MAGDEIGVTVPGNLTGDPELRFTTGGTPVANFTVASTPRNYDRQNNEWKDGETTFLKCTAWRELAENVAESFVKGSPVMVQGNLITKKFNTREGDERKVHEIEVENVGPNLRYGTSKFTKTQRTGNYQHGGGQRQGGGQPQSSAPQGGANDDPWGAPAGGNAPANNQQPANNNPANDDPWA